MPNISSGIASQLTLHIKRNGLTETFHERGNDIKRYFGQKCTSCLSHKCFSNASSIPRLV